MALSDIFFNFSVFWPIFQKSATKSVFNLMITTKTLQIPKDNINQCQGRKNQFQKLFSSYFRKIKALRRKFCMEITSLIKENVTSRILVLGGQFLHQIKPFWSSNFDAKTGFIGVKEKLLRFFFTQNFTDFRDFLDFFPNIQYRKNFSFIFLHFSLQIQILHEKLAKKWYNMPILFACENQFPCPQNITKSLKRVICFEKDTNLFYLFY